MVDRKSSQTKTFSQNMFYMFYLYNFSVKCIIKNFYFPLDGPLNLMLTDWFIFVFVMGEADNVNK